MLKDLIKVSNSLDSKGFRKEADELDRIIRKLAQEEPPTSDNPYPGEPGTSELYEGAIKPVNGGNDPYTYDLSKDEKTYWAYKDGKRFGPLTDDKGLEIVKRYKRLGETPLEPAAPAAPAAPAVTEESAHTRGPDTEQALRDLADKIRRENVGKQWDSNYGEQRLREAADLLSEDQENFINTIKNKANPWQNVLKQIKERIKTLQHNAKANASDDALFAEASRKEKRISKIASLLSGEFNGLAKSVRR